MYSEKGSTQTKTGPNLVYGQVQNQSRQCSWGWTDGAWKGGIASVLNSTPQYAIKTCVMENPLKGYRGRNISIFSNSQAAIKALDSSQINSKFAWECHQSLVKLAEHKRIKLIWVPIHLEIDRNTKKKVLHIYSQNLSLHLVHLQKLPEGWSRTRWAENIWSIGSQHMHKGRLWDFFFKKTLKKSWGIAQPEHKPS